MLPKKFLNILLLFFIFISLPLFVYPSYVSVKNQYDKNKSLERSIGTNDQVLKTYSVASKYLNFIKKDVSSLYELGAKGEDSIFVLNQLTGFSADPQVYSNKVLPMATSEESQFLEYRVELVGSLRGVSNYSKKIHTAGVIFSVSELKVDRISEDRYKAVFAVKAHTVKGFNPI